MNKIVNIFLWKDIHKCNAETKELSLKVLETLERQEQSLLNANKNMTESNNLLYKSDKALNNMSWVGWFIEFIVPFKTFFLNLLTRNKKEEKLFIENIDVKDNYEINYRKNECNNDHSLLLYSNENLNENLNENDIEMLKLEKELNDLLWIGTKIGQSLDLQNDYIDKLNAKTEILFDKTSQSTKKTNNFL